MCIIYTWSWEVTGIHVPPWPPCSSGARPARAAAAVMLSASLMTGTLLLWWGRLTLLPCLKWTDEVMLCCHSIRCLAGGGCGLLPSLQWSYRGFCTICKQVQGPGHFPTTSSIVVALETAWCSGCCRCCKAASHPVSPCGQSWWRERCFMSRKSAHRTTDRSDRDILLAMPHLRRGSEIPGKPERISRRETQVLHCSSTSLRKSYCSWSASCKYCPEGEDVKALKFHLSTCGVVGFSKVWTTVFGLKGTAL